MAVCPAGEDVIGEFLENRKDFLKEVVKPLQDKKNLSMWQQALMRKKSLPKDFQTR